MKIQIVTIISVKFYNFILLADNLLSRPLRQGSNILPPGVAGLVLLLDLPFSNTGAGEDLTLS